MTGTLKSVQSAGSGARRTDLDGVRILICAAIILAHALLIFAAEPRYHLKSEQPLVLASVLYEFMRITTLPVFFVLAGWSALTSLRGRGAGRFVRERVTRLLPPLVAGTLLFGPVIKYIELSHGRDMGLHGFRLVDALHIAFLDFLPGSLTKVKLVSWSHLWFLAYLFLISLLLLPLLVRLARRVPVAALPAAPVVYLPAFVMAALLVAFDGYWPFLPNLVTDKSNLGYFTLCFAVGAGLAAWPGFEMRLRIEAPCLLALMLLAFAGVVLCGESAAGRVFVGFTAWGAIGAGLGFAARVRPAASPTLAYLSEATLPVYIVHHVPLLLLGAAVLPLAIPAWIKIALIASGTSVISLAAFHWLIRPWRSVRLLMGMGAPKAAMPVPNPTGAPA
ncbi:acyltransferase family protein [Bradyrhizobium sp. LHD-71]|uniref:acyltransferase family protein n=1 Tax=Bradyrhizobium sp. LHD-71 TaxID=3072141 RepID=UPI00280D3A3C|nr:acyltransferase family protein [Bradyrhizobium sp. LHD-71]MDQ8726970.1 acyltransferase family protein [Bradyrhizobium sp. LHD-71]